MKRSRPPAVLLLFLLLTACHTSRPASPATQPAADGIRIVTGPYLQAPAPDSMTIVWATNRRCASRVEYRAENEADFRLAAAAHDGLADVGTLHKIALTDLKPGTRYIYRIASTELTFFKQDKVRFGETIHGEEATFATLSPAARPFSFIVLNDRHERINALRQAISAINWSDVDLAFLNGDMFDYVDGEAQVFRCLTDPCTQSFARQIPFIFLRGNHELRGSYTRELLRYFPTTTGRWYHALEHGGVFFLCLDGSETKLDADPGYFGLVNTAGYLAEQTDWLKRQLESDAFKKAAWRIVLVHIPPVARTDSPSIREKWILDHWSPLFSAAGVDLVLSGHLHTWRHTPPGEQRYHLLMNGTDTTLRINVTPESLDIHTLKNDGAASAPAIRVGRRP